MTKEDLIAYFTRDIKPVRIGQSIGMEIETSFITADGNPISLEQSRAITRRLFLYEWSPWYARKVEKGGHIVKVEDSDGNAILYDLGWQNFELATVPMPKDKIVDHAKKLLAKLYEVAQMEHAFPYFGPILETTEDTLVIPDERDQVWLDLDGREALAPLARISSVQFTFAVEGSGEAITYLNRLGRTVGHFLEAYPQDRVWKEYIQKSHAGYHPLRYGGPLFFRDVEDYCEKLLEHDYIDGSRLVPCEHMQNFDIPLFLRSVWWYFRLRRYGNNLCIEVRPLGRYEDDRFEKQLMETLSIMAYGHPRGIVLTSPYDRQEEIPIKPIKPWGASARILE